jgi:ParB family chromosome partitioning protein
MRTTKRNRMKNVTNKNISIDKIEDIPIENIERNKLNPRLRYNKEKEQELKESLEDKGVLNPLVVYKKDGQEKYTLLDGERRYRMCKRIGISLLPCRVRTKEPNTLEIYSLMFHIHNVQEEWTEFAIALTIHSIVKEVNKTVINLTKEDKGWLSKITSLSPYKVDKYLKFLKYPDNVINRFKKSEEEDVVEEGADPDILIEMYDPIQKIKNNFPKLIQKYNEYNIIDACIKKKAKGIIKTNKEFRYLKKSFKAFEEDKVSAQVFCEYLENFITKLNVTPESIYKLTAESIDQLKSILEITEELHDELNNITLTRLTGAEKEEIKVSLRRLIKIINARFLK